MNDEQRIMKLVGDGKDGNSGGIPLLPNAFGAVLEYLTDSGIAPAGVLITRVIERMHSQEKRIISVFGSWEDFGEAIIEQLALRDGIIQPEGAVLEGERSDRPHWIFGYRWELHPDFEAGRSYEIITAGQIAQARGDSAKHAEPIKVMIFSAAVRHARDKNAQALAIARKAVHATERIGELNGKLGSLYGQIIELLEDPPKRGQKAFRPPRLPDEDVMVTCEDGGELLPKTFFHFSQYYGWPGGSTEGKWYWRRSCREHYREGGMLTRMEELRAVFEGLGKNPTEGEVAARSGRTRGSSLRKDWDVLAEYGFVPVRPRK